MNYLDLLPKFAAGTASPAEREAFNNWLDSLSPEAFRDVLARYEALLATQQQFDPHNEPMLQSILQKLDGQQSPFSGTVKPMISRTWFRVAAAVTLLVGTGLYFLMFNKKAEQPANDTVATTQPAGADLPPGKEGAILTLADGRTIVLDSLQPGAIAREGNNNIVLNNGSLNYTQLHTGSANQGAVMYNTMQTPRGRQFQLSLPDGTKVWLNAMSSIRFPVAFAGDSREVTITGEAYLEVARDPRKKFIVKSNEVTTEVLGTSFNVNAYEDEETVRITLLEGKVASSNPISRTIISPGMQARFKTNEAVKVSTVDTDQAVAWKNGVFNFQQSNLQSVMRQIARWYDVEIVYEKGLPDTKFDGKIQRSLSLKQILKGLEDEDISFRIDGKKLIVSP